LRTAPDFPFSLPAAQSRNGTREQKREFRMTQQDQTIRALEAQVQARDARLERLERKYARTKRYLMIAAAPYALLLSPVLLPLLAIRHVRRKRRGRGSRPRRGAPPQMLGTLAGQLRTLPEPARDAEAERAVDAREDNFALCRVIGNDLTPRHRKGQSYDNVRFILENEPPLEGCRKLWLVNRIADPEEEARIMALLEEHGQDYERIPFEWDAFLRVGYDFSTFPDPALFVDKEELAAIERPDRALLQTYRAKNNYVMNNNGARNAALDLCLNHAKWALPWDGNCFVTAAAWRQIRADVVAARDKRYFLVPMARVTDNALLTDPEYRPEAAEEPQMIFRCDATERFDPGHPYGRRPKVELFLHLGVPGPWERWPNEFWDMPPRRVSTEGYRTGRAGWVARLDSGQAHLEQSSTGSFLDRGRAREMAIKTTIDALEWQAIRPRLEEGAPVFFRRDRIATLAGADGPLAPSLREAAAAAGARGPYSVTDKKTTAPSGDSHDYWHPAPYWWPNPGKANGLPYIRRDGERVPGTELYSPESDKYDRTRLQRLVDDTTVLALAATALDDAEAGARARLLLRHWFVEPATRMNPHLAYAQVRMGHDGNRGAAQGLIETKDFYFLLDAVRLLGDPELDDELRPWARAFFDWLLTSAQGEQEQQGPNNHGTCYDLQVASFAAWLGDADVLFSTYHRSQARVFQQIDETGWQAHEMRRSLTQHYCAFNLQCWCNLFQLYAGMGFRPWQSPAAERLCTGLDWFLAQDHEAWPYQQIAPFDQNRLRPLAQARRIAGAETGLPPADPDAPVLFDPHDGIAPFWQLAF